MWHPSKLLVVVCHNQCPISIKTKCDYLVFVRVREVQSGNQCLAAIKVVLGVDLNYLAVLRHLDALTSRACGTECQHCLPLVSYMQDD